MIRNRTICIKVTEKEEKNIRELREEGEVNISHIVREFLKKEYKKFKRER